MEFEYRYGFPILHAKDIIPAFGMIGEKVWPLIDTASVEDYLQRDLTPSQKAELRFLPKLQAAVFRNPAGEPQTYFRTTRGARYAMVFTLLPEDLVPITASFRHGIERIMLDLPGGRIEREETPDQAGAREYREELGITLERVEALSPAGLPSDPQNSSNLDFPCLGFPKLPITRAPQKLDRGEFLQAMLIPLAECLKLLKLGVAAESMVITIFLALKALDRLTVR